MTSLPALHITSLAESALLIRVGPGEHVDQEIVEAVWLITGALDAAALPGVTDVVPGYCTVLIQFDVAATDHLTLEKSILEAIHLHEGEAAPEGRHVVIPICYGGEHGPDLPDVVAHTGLHADEVIRLHAATDYRVACMGFAPGWAYLIGLPKELHVPRRANPRPKVPAGSLAVGGGHTGVYPLDTPGGWHLFGRTPVKMFDPKRAEPFLLQPGDHVRYQPITPEEFTRLESELARG